MTGAAGRTTVAAAALLPAALALAACSGSGHPAHPRAAAAAGSAPERIIRAPERLLAAALPQPNGVMWGLTRKPDAGLFEIDSTSGQVAGSVPVSGAARSVAESSTGVLGVALGTRRAGALEFLDGRTARVTRTVALPAPARDVAVGSDGVTFYALTRAAGAATVTIVNSQNGQVRGTVPVPAGAVSVVPDIAQDQLYVLGRDGTVSVVSISGGKVSGRFTVGRENAWSIALSPDGSTLYVLKGSGPVANVAVVDANTESVREVLPAPSGCREVMVSADGKELYEVVGTAKYGNIQVFPR